MAEIIKIFQIENKIDLSKYNYNLNSDYGSSASVSFFN